MDSWGLPSDQFGSICLKNQVFGDINCPQQNAISQDHESDLGITSKRSEHKGLCSSTPLCKVFGCNKNLSDCKEYGEGDAGGSNDERERIRNPATDSGQDRWSGESPAAPASKIPPTSGGTNEQIKYMVSQGCIKPLCDLLVCPDPRIVTVSLEGLENILKVGEVEKQAGNTGDVNYHAQLIDDAEGLEKIENLQSQDNNEIYEKAVKILETYWVDEDDENVVDGAQGVRADNVL